MPPIAQLVQVSKSYRDGAHRVDVLQQLDFAVAAGESVAVMGPSGSGKSTLLNILAGIVSCDQGEVWLHTPDGAQPLHQLSERQRTRIRRAHIAFVHQFFNLVPTLTVLENVQLPAQLNRRRDLFGAAPALLESFGLAGRGDDFPEILSGGEQQRVAVARALLMRPAILLADEPTGNLDPANSKAVADALFDAADRLDVALVVATHSDELARRADRRVRLNAEQES